MSLLTRTKMLERSGKAGEEGTITVEMKWDLPEIAGIDGGVYGPFEAGSVVKLPYLNGRAFVNHGDAVEVTA